jgi:hypothetical protein
MNLSQLIPILPLLTFACTKANHEGPVEDLTPYENLLQIQATAYHLPLNEYGSTRLSAITEFGNETTNLTDFYIDGIKLEGNIFTPVDTGVYTITGIYLDLKSAPIKIRVSPDRNKKILVEYFTSRTCGWCPWISSRLDSLDVANHAVISYAIHGEDEFTIPDSEPLQAYLSVYAHPAIRVNRGYVRNYAAPIEIKELVDSVRHALSKQTPVQIKIETQTNQNTLDIQVSARFFELLEDSIYLSVLVIEDNMTSYGQYNYFSGANQPGCPYNTQPNPIPTYTNHNVLRQLLTDVQGNLISSGEVLIEEEIPLANFIYHIPQDFNVNNASVIALIHQRRENIEISSVINTQSVRFGSTVGFED